MAAKALPNTFSYRGIPEVHYEYPILSEFEMVKEGIGRGARTSEEQHALATASFLVRLDNFQLRMELELTRALQSSFLLLELEQDATEEQRELHRYCCRRFVRAVKLMLQTLQKSHRELGITTTSSVHKHPRSSEKEETPFYSTQSFHALLRRPEHLACLLRMSVSAWCPIRCTAIGWLSDIFDGNGLMQVQLADGKPFVYHAIAFITAALSNHAISTHPCYNDDPPQEPHEPEFCSGCWQITMTKLTDALERSRSIISPKVIVEEVLPKYGACWSSTFDAANSADADKLYTMNVNLWLQLHRMAHLVVLVEGGTQTRTTSSPALYLLQIQLGQACLQLFHNTLEQTLLDGGLFVQQSSNNDPTHLAVKFNWKSRFVMWYYNCLIPRERDPQLVGLRRRVRAHLLDLLANNVSTWPKATINACHVLSCWLKDSTWNHFHETLPANPEQQWSTFEILLFGPDQVYDKQKQRLLRIMLMQTIGVDEPRCSTCWRTQEDLLLASKKDRRRNGVPYDLRVKASRHWVCGLCEFKRIENMMITQAHMREQAQGVEGQTL
ncbi:expressed unknown protein [Seminavis robusta]|uniref:Uncharacterized protein n=1 Tax=Seminavis robusta TaxID=568900 RepID=A0A9N8DIF1_9STRA|nr:expressed unknown protein [Seminavis robusta]|eukprot:Sro105_g053310.1 n/a (554) ;mRNA; f:89315-90976